MTRGSKEWAENTSPESKTDALDFLKEAEASNAAPSYFVTSGSGTDFSKKENQEGEKANVIEAPPKSYKLPLHSTGKIHAKSLRSEGTRYRSGGFKRGLPTFQSYFSHPIFLNPLFATLFSPPRV